VVAALSGVCPRCGERTLFAGLLEFAPQCRSCRLDIAAFNVGDGPAAFLILIVGAILSAAAICVELSFSPPYWMHIVWLPVAAALTIAGLRVGKAFMLAQEYRHQAREGRISR
jgi:uncharacterized protein (DUF983 family)